MGVFKPHEQGSTEKIDAATKKLDEEMAKYYGIPIESARELGSELEADALSSCYRDGNRTTSPFRRAIGFVE